MEAMKIFNIAAAIIACGSGAANAAGGQCMPCPDGKVCTGGAAAPKDCTDGVPSKDKSKCITLTAITEEYFEAMDKPAAGQCASGVMSTGIYRIALGGGDGAKDGNGGTDGVSPGAKFTYNFTLKQNASYEICTGAAGKPGSAGQHNVVYPGTGGGGGGSYLKLSIGNDTAYFIASGGPGSSVHDYGNYLCYGGYGGGLGNGINGGINCSGQGRPQHNAYSEGVGGSNGSGNAAGYQSLSIKTLNSAGAIKPEGTKNYGSTHGQTAPASHATNVSDPGNCTSCAILYRLRR